MPSKSQTLGLDNKKLERFKGPIIIFGSVCLIAGVTEVTNIRKQVIRNMIAREQPDIIGLIETNIQNEKYELKGIGSYIQYKTEPNKNKGVMMIVKEELHPVLNNRLYNRGIIVTIYEGKITIITAYVTYKEGINEVREWIMRNIPENQGFIIVVDFFSFQKSMEKTIEANWKQPSFSREGERKRNMQRSK